MKMPKDTKQSFTQTFYVDMMRSHKQDTSGWLRQLLMESLAFLFGSIIPEAPATPKHVDLAGELAEQVAS